MTVFEIYHIDKVKMVIHRESVPRTHKGAHEAMDALTKRKKDEFFSQFTHPEEVKKENPDIFYQDHGIMLKEIKVST